MAKKNIYVVGYGIHPDTRQPVIGAQFKTWDECKPYIENVQNAKYKGFYTQEEADAWLDKIKKTVIGNIGNGGNKPPVSTGYSSEGRSSEPEHSSSSGVMTAINRDFVFACNSRGYDPFKVLDMLKLMFIHNADLADKYLVRQNPTKGNGLDIELPWN